MKCNKKFLQQDIRERLGKHVTLKDLSNLRAKLKDKNDGELTEAVKFLINEKGEAKHEFCSEFSFPFL